MIKRLFHTLRYLQPRQIRYQLFYRLTGRLAENNAQNQGDGAQVQGALGAKPVMLPFSAKVGLLASALPVRLDEAGFCFLNQTVGFPSFGTIDWNYAANGKLWTYNLNYFEYLRQPGASPVNGQELINSWIEAEPSHKDGWEPYPLSLRLINWLQFYRTTKLAVPEHVEVSIRRQYAALWRKLEFHLGGNHLLENAISLAFTARYLNDEAGCQKADKLLLTELKEQYLSDGAHYERSIMYHLILLWRQLDLYSWLGASEGWNDQWEVAQPSRTLTEVRSCLQRQLSWAAAMITTDGRYPHFNDSTNGIAPDWKVIKSYAAGLGLEIPTTAVLGATGGAGYRHWSADGLDVWMDAGAIGPDYIPGHAHADNLNFVLHLNGEPVIIDPAISTYEKNARRAWERSTAAHNTVTVNEDQNSSDVWGGFRVGKRARTTIKTDQEHRLTAAHDGYPATLHTRHFSLEAPAQRLTIHDHLVGAVEKGVARLYFAPDQKLGVKGNKVTTKSCQVIMEGATKVSRFTYKKAGGWNLLVEAAGIEIHFETSLTVEIVPLRP